MFDSRQEPTPEEAHRLIEELELNHPKRVMEVRCVDGVEIKATVWVESGNATDRDGHKLVGTSSRIGQLNLTTVFRWPLSVGDVYRITFDRESLNLNPCYAVCRKCCLVNEETFQSTLTFFAPDQSGLGAAGPSRVGNARCPYGAADWTCGLLSRNLSLSWTW